MARHLAFDLSFFLPHYRPPCQRLFWLLLIFFIFLYFLTFPAHKTPKKPNTPLFAIFLEHLSRVFLAGWTFVVQRTGPLSDAPLCLERP